LTYLCRSGLKREGKLIIARAGDPKRTASADIAPERDPDNFISIQDIVRYAKHFGKKTANNQQPKQRAGISFFFVFFCLFTPFGEFFQGAFYLLVDEVAYAQEGQVHLFYRILQFLLNVFPHFHIIVFFAQRFESPSRRVSRELILRREAEMLLFVYEIFNLGARRKSF